MNILDDVIYLDNAFIVDAYQKIKKKNAPVKHIKTTDVSTGINAFVRAGASLKETFEYPINTYTTYKDIIKELNDIEGIELTQENIKELPEICWVDGVLGIVQITQNVGKSDARVHYTFAIRNLDKTQQLYLTTNNVYFSSGYDSILDQADTSAYGFTIEVKILLKFLGTTKHHSLASPLIIIKKGNYSFTD